jgi:hypothetical protein
MSISIWCSSAGCFGEVGVTSRKPAGGRRSLQPAACGTEQLAPVPEPTRAGEDVRRRGWFWHWNALVTQYAPLIGLKGVGLLNSYTVWTDRREESPHRGYAFPSQQREADFYGEERAELITINKILVALDLIEIRKEMVLRADPQGRRWKVPHNFSRVKDHGDDFTLSTDDVLRVAALAASDRAVYRYVRRVFSPRFAPIDGDNVWGRILEEVRQQPVWQQLATRAASEEDRASARTRAGHAARRGSTSDEGTVDDLAAAPFFVSTDGDETASPPEHNDSASVTSLRAMGEDETSVAAINTGCNDTVGPSNKGSRGNRRSAVAPGNTGQATAVAPTNTTYHQTSTTTNDDRRTQDDDRALDEFAAASPGVSRATRAQAGGPAQRPPGDAPAAEATMRAFEGANDRAATPAERKLLVDLAARFQPVAAAAHEERPDVPTSGWSWVEAAVWEAVEAGSAFVAPRRLREILLRWERDGFPALSDPTPPSTDPPGPPRGERPRPPRTAGEPGAVPLPLPVLFTVEEVGLSNRQVWAATLAEMARQGSVSQAELETWLRPAGLVGRRDDTFIVGAPNGVARDRIAARLLPALRDALTAMVGVTVAVEVVVEGDDAVQRESEAAS